MTDIHGTESSLLEVAKDQQHGLIIDIIDNNDCSELNVLRDEKLAFAERLNNILDRAGFTPMGKGRQKELAKLFGVSTRGAGKWLEGDAIPNISTKLPDIIDKFKDYGASMEWLLMGNPEFDPENPHNRRISDELERSQITIELKKITVIGSILFHDDGGFSELNTSTSGFVVFPIRSSHACAILCCGEGISPRVRHGEFIIIDKEAKAENGDDVLIMSKAGTYLLKDFLYEKDDFYYVISINNSHKKSIHKNDVLEMYPVIGIVNKSLFVSDEANKKYIF